jgi:hypothetical protein
VSEKPEWVCELRVCAHLAHACLYSKDLEDAEAMADRAMAIMDRSEGPPLLASAFDGVVSIAHVYLSLCEWRLAKGYACSSLERRAVQALDHCGKLARLFPIAVPSQLVCSARYEALRKRPHRARKLRELARRTAADLDVTLDEAIDTAPRT